MKEVFIYPIPNRNCCDNFKLQEDILLYMTKLLDILMKRLYVIRFIEIESQTGQMIQGFMDITGLIIHNQLFTEIQIANMVRLAKTLINKVKQIPKDFIFNKF